MSAPTTHATTRPGPLPGAGVVTTWMPELVGQAREFAANHDRWFAPWAPAAPPDAFAEGIPDAASLTVFAPAEQMTSALLDSLAQLSVQRELPIGLVPCAPASQLPLAPLVDPPDESLPARTLLYSYFFARHGIPDTADVYGRPSSAEFLDAAARGAETIILHTHGNGADAPVSEAILCSRVETGPATTTLTRSLPCQLDGPCVREHHDVRFYFGPSFLRCHALVFLSCTGFPPADSLLQYEASLVHAALRGGRIRSIVTSTRMTGSSDLSLALSTKSYLDDGHTMGELALAINHSDAEGRPHYVCIGDPEYRPIRGPLAPGPVRQIPDPPPSDAHRATKAVIAIAEAELLARGGSSSWPPIADRIAAADRYGETAAHAPLPAPPTLVGTHEVPIERFTERVMGAGRCPRCLGPIENYLFRPAVARGELLIGCCRTHGIVTVEAQFAEHDVGGHATPRAARWLSTAFALRRVAKDVDVERHSPLDLAQTLEQAALSGEEFAGSRELDCRIADAFGAAVTAGSELFHSRQQRFLSASRHGAATIPHHCGRVLMYVDFRSLPMRLTRRVWFCPLCGVAGNTLRDHELPGVSVADGRWHADPCHGAFAESGCALTLAWEPRGLHRDTWATSTWIDGPSEGPLAHAGHERFGGLRFLNAVMVADAELVTVRVPLHFSPSDGRLHSLRQLNDHDGTDTRLPWQRAWEIIDRRSDVGRV